MLPVEDNPYICFILPERPNLTSYPHVRKLSESYFDAFSVRSKTHSTKYLINVSCLTRGTTLTRKLNMCNSRHFIEVILLYRTTTPTHVSFSGYWRILSALNQSPPIFCNPFITILVNTTKIYQCTTIARLKMSKSMEVSTFQNKSSLSEASVTTSPGSAPSSLICSSRLWSKNYIFE